MANYKMLLLIAQNPYSKEPKELFDRLSGFDEDIEDDKELDKQGFEILRQTISRNSKNIIVKW